MESVNVFTEISSCHYEERHVKCVYEKGDKERLIYEVIDERNEKLLIRGIHYRIIKWVNASEVVDADDCSHNYLAA